MGEETVQQKEEDIPPITLAKPVALQEGSRRKAADYFNPSLMATPERPFELEGRRQRLRRINAVPALEATTSTAYKLGESAESDPGPQLKSKRARSKSPHQDLQRKDCKAESKSVRRVKIYKKEQLMGSEASSLQDATESRSVRKVEIYQKGAQQLMGSEAASSLPSAAKRKRKWRR